MLILSNLADSTAASITTAVWFLYIFILQEKSVPVSHCFIVCDIIWGSFFPLAIWLRKVLQLTLILLNQQLHLFSLGVLFQILLKFYYLPLGSSKQLFLEVQKDFSQETSLYLVTLEECWKFQVEKDFKVGRWLVWCGCEHELHRECEENSARKKKVNMKVIQTIMSYAK